MSGGVDSTITAALLIEEGHEVEGFTLDLLPDWLAASETPVVQAARAAQELGIPHHTVDLREAFQEKVLSPFAHDYAQGRTPNPCILCNESIKFGLLFDWASSQGFDYLATGHYVRNVPGDSRNYLARPADTSKDQTYFMYRVRPEIISQLKFPLADLTKPQVRKIAETKGLTVATKPESQDTCFSAQCSHIEVARHYASCDDIPGEIINTKGEIVGSHQGLIHYTVGQRKGLPAGLGEPHYVIGLDTSNNRVIIGKKEDTYIRRVMLVDVVGDFEVGKTYLAQIRYRMKAVPALVEEFDSNASTMTLYFSEALSGIARGQSAVCYSNFKGFEILLGGGVIECVD